MILTNENYFSSKNQQKYMGSSQFKAFMECEAAALAEINGEFEREKTTSLLVGSYVDAHFEKTLDIFEAKNQDIFTKQGGLKSEFEQANYIIERAERDELFMRYMSGKKQVIKTGEIEGVPFKIKIDSFHPGKAIVDLKVMKDFAPVWKEGKGKLNFIEAWGYDIQGAIYQHIEGNNLPFYIAAVTKEKEPDMAVIQISQEYLDAAFEIVRQNVLRFDAIKKGLIEPKRCERCNYCRRTKVLTEIMSMEDLDYAEQC